MVFADGPNGPPKVFKKGLLHIAQKSAAPVVAMQIEMKYSISVNTWDKKRFPLPFNHFTLIFRAPTEIHQINEEVIALIESKMSSS